VADAQADAVAGACVAVDGFGVGFASSVPSGATVIHLADDGSGFHADDLGNMQVGSRGAGLGAMQVGSRGAGLGAAVYTDGLQSHTDPAPHPPTNTHTHTCTHIQMHNTHIPPPPPPCRRFFCRQRRWDSHGAVTFTSPDYRDSDLVDLERLGQLAQAAAAAAAKSARASAVTTHDPVAQARAALDRAYASAGALQHSGPVGRSPEAAFAAEEEDCTCTLRLTLLQHVFPSVAASPGGIPLSAAKAPVSYFSSSSGVAFMLGASLGIFLDLRGERYLKLFLACRRFRYELLVVPGVPSPRPPQAQP
jgi:hypothetical protein